MYGREEGLEKDSAGRGGKCSRPRPRCLHRPQRVYPNTVLRRSPGGTAGEQNPLETPARSRPSGHHERRIPLSHVVSLAAASAATPPSLTPPGPGADLAMSPPKGPPR